MQQVWVQSPGQGAKIPHASWPENQNIKQKQYCNKFNEDFKNGPHQKKKVKESHFKRPRLFNLLSITRYVDFTQTQEVSTIWQGVRNGKEKAKTGSKTSIKLELGKSGSWKNHRITAIKGISYRPNNQ